MDSKKKVLFLCTGNSCRSQMAEGWLRHLAGDRMDSLSAGTHPSFVHPSAIRVMAEEGVDLSGHTSDGLTAHLNEPPDLVIAVCAAAADRCPSFPGEVPVLRWPVSDPVTAGTAEEGLPEFRRIRDELKGRIEVWLADGAAPLGEAGSGNSECQAEP